MNPIVGASIEGAGNVFSDIVNNVAGYYAQKRQHKYNKELLDKQLALNKEMAQYNYDNFQSPSAQLKGYRDAGINENLAYGQLSSGQTSAETPEVPQNQAYTYQVDSLSKIGDTINNYYKLQTQDEELKLIEERVRREKIENNILESIAQSRIEATNSKNAKEIFELNKTLDYMEEGFANGGYDAIQSIIDPAAFGAKKKAEMWKKQADWQATENQLNRIHQLDMQAKQMADNMRRLVLSNKHAKELKEMDIKHDLFKFNENLNFQKGSSEAQLYLGIAKTIIDGLTSLGAGSLIKKGFKLFGKKRR